ncbi:hypothetical protein JG688_00017383 [Phytophthora aleatoria]|uniref:Uncharacterized protein n=1 Tax=Phytophthora aleatoria TaxID=2496075 RepID=A0A8J5IDY1_9STRA|nr:hypothetical protein JG688_00017383 [Phytophthora aleatoria]
MQMVNLTMCHIVAISNVSVVVKVGQGCGTISFRTGVLARICRSWFSVSRCHSSITTRTT